MSENTTNPRVYLTETMTEAEAGVLRPLLQLGLPDSEVVVCGVALGWPDPQAPANQTQTEREPLAQRRGLAARRQQQAQAWMWERIDGGLKHAFRHHPGVRAALQTTESEVRQGALPPSIAARRLLQLAGLAQAAA